jgi:hypothetical protein
MVLVPVQILSSSLKTVSIAGVLGHVRISPLGIRVGVLIPTWQSVRIVAIVQPINVSAHLTAIVTVVVSGLVPVAKSMLEVIVLAHISFVTFVGKFEFSSVEIVLFMAVSILAALVYPVPVAVLITVLF